MKVGLFDSGIGGLTVLKTLLKKYPDNDYIYYGDTLNNPYGSKNKKELFELSCKNIEFLIDKGASVIVVACGTVSSNCLDELKMKYKIPIYDIISPIINYINNSNYDNIGVIATSATINSHVFKNRINKRIYEIETSFFVPCIEENNYLCIDKLIDEYLSNYKNKIDYLILGCTHYPILIPYLKKKIPSCELLDMSYYLDIPFNDGNGNIDIYFSKVNDKIILNTKRILDMDVSVREK